MFPSPRTGFTPQQYLRLDRETGARAEYYNGEIIPLPDGSPDRSLVQTNLEQVIGRRLDREAYRLFNSDMRIYVTGSGLYTHADFVVVRGNPQFADGSDDTLVNPLLVVEVASLSTENYDRADKFAHYRMIQELQQYVIVCQHQMLVEVYGRTDGEWAFSSAAALPGDIVQLPSVRVEFPVEELYDGMEVSPPPRWPKRSAASE